MVCDFAHVLIAKISWRAMMRDESLNRIFDKYTSTNASKSWRCEQEGHDNSSFVIYNKPKV